MFQFTKLQHNDNKTPETVATSMGKQPTLYRPDPLFGKLKLHVNLARYLQQGGFLESRAEFPRLTTNEM